MRTQYVELEEGILMRTANYLRKLVLPGLAATALMATSVAPAFAAATLQTAAEVIYASSAITSNSTNVTDPQVVALSSNAGITGATTAVLPQVAISLPGAGTFVGLPTGTKCFITGGVVLTVADTCSVVNTQGSGTGTVTLNLSYTTIAADCTVAAPCGVTVSWNSFVANNLGVLSTPTAAGADLKLSTTTNVDPGGIFTPAAPSVAFAKSALPLALAAGPATSPLAIDVTSPTLGKKFLQNNVDSTSGDLGTVQISTNAVVDNGGTLQFVPPALTVALGGNFNNISSVFLAANNLNNCSTSTGNVGTATPAGATVSIASVPTSAKAGTVSYEVCLVANGTGLIGSNNTPPTLSATASAPTISLTSNGLSPDPYNGGVQQIQYSGIQPGYTSYLRVVNNSGATATVTAVFQSELGTITTSTVVAALAANDNTLIPVSSLITAAGLDPTLRASLVTLAPSTSVLVSQLMVNPNGTLVNIQ
jgi:hypothetical protein